MSEQERTGENEETVERDLAVDEDERETGNDERVDEEGARY